MLTIWALILFAYSPSGVNASLEAKADEVEASTKQTSEPLGKSARYYHEVMNSPPRVLSNDSNKTTTNYCGNVANLASTQNPSYLSSSQIDYQRYGWEKRSEAAWTRLSAQYEPVSHKSGSTSATEGDTKGTPDIKVLVVDIKQRDGKPAYHYYSDGRHNDLYEPWSSSKIFAYTGAMAKLKQQYPTLDALGSIGEVPISDLITSINTYERSGLADGNSNAIATFFTNIAGRDYLTSLFYDSWLKLSTPNLIFRGSYGAETFSPSNSIYAKSLIDSGIGSGNSNDNGIGAVTPSLSPLQKIEYPISFTINFNNDASRDTGYRNYRCEACGLTGNKAMTTLGQAEWLKRLIMHSADPSTAHPFITRADIDVLLFGTASKHGGMSAGISNILQNALSDVIDVQDREVYPVTSKQPYWQIFNKIGWGESETRSASEVVVLAHVCIPSPSETRSFVVSASVSVGLNPNEITAKESAKNIGFAGRLMQKTLEQSLKQILSKP